jgi:hypothetical protein
MTLSRLISFWIPGFFGILAATPQQPGWSLASIYDHTDVSASGNAALAREITIGQFNPKINISVDANIHGVADLGFVIPSYVFGAGNSICGALERRGRQLHGLYHRRHLDWGASQFLTKQLSRPCRITSTISLPPTTVAPRRCVPSNPASSASAHNSATCFRSGICRAISTLKVTASSTTTLAQTDGICG